MCIIRAYRSCRRRAHATLVFYAALRDFSRPWPAELRPTVARSLDREAENISAFRPDESAAARCEIELGERPEVGGEVVDAAERPRRRTRHRSFAIYPDLAYGHDQS